MTASETTRAIRIISAAYPHFKPSQDVIDLWGVMFNSAPFEAVSAALYTYIARNHDFPPTPGNINALIYDLTHKGELSEIDAWNMVCKAMRNGLYGSHEEFAKLPEDVQEAIGSPRYLYELALQEDLNVSVESSNFFKRYRAVLERKKNDAMIPQAVKELTNRTINLLSVNDNLPTE